MTPVPARPCGGCERDPRNQPGAVLRGDANPLRRATGSVRSVGVSELRIPPGRGGGSSLSLSEARSLRSPNRESGTGSSAGEEIFADGVSSAHPEFLISKRAGRSRQSDGENNTHCAEHVNGEDSDTALPVAARPNSRYTNRFGQARFARVPVSRGDRACVARKLRKRGRDRNPL